MGTTFSMARHLDMHYFRGAVSVSTRHVSRACRKTTAARRISVSTWIRSPLHQVVEKRRADEARSLQGSWFPSVMRRMVIMTQGKDGGEIPQCVTKLAAALHKVRCIESDDVYGALPCDLLHRNLPRCHSVKVA